MARELTRKMYCLTKKDYISQSPQRHSDLKNNQKFLLCAPVRSARKIYYEYEEKRKATNLEP